MKNIIQTTIAAATLALSLGSINAQATEYINCNVNSKKMDMGKYVRVEANQKKFFNACELTNAQSSQLAPLLPMKMSSLLTMEGVHSIKNILTMMITMDVTAKEFEVTKNSYGGSKEHHEAMTEVGRNATCSKSVAKEFFNIGGAYTFEYYLPNGTLAYSINIDHC